MTREEVRDAAARVAHAWEERTARMYAADKGAKEVRG